ncbi:hypothetical protein FA95DRAFT_1609635 [Auriscalpium vulgare]|uniref:Uncharacterized protein n=1 Tax=Auriscalpium vulgare TaxID=40419 RepID=A0ACB8RGV0_9AGAM|nr:hypothetical protein FA95DRAFT_1609635 [Auriscalpium vulgare]
MRKSLPPELLLLVVELGSPDVQLVVRTLSKQFCALATPVAFRTLRCLNTPRSASGFLSILDHTDLKDHVKNVVYYDVDGAREWYGQGGDMDDDEHIDLEYAAETDLSDAEEDELFVTLTEAFSRLHTLPSLNAISVTFPLGFYTFYPDFDDGILLSAYEARVASVPELRIQLEILARLEVFATARYFASQGLAPLRSLTIRNLNSFFNHRLSFSTFRRLFEGLTTLRLSIFTSIDATENVLIPSLTYFCTKTLPPLLRACTSTLTSLTFQLDQVFGHDVDLFLGDLHYPHLRQYLSLCSVLFSDATGIETLITSHAHTLRSLITSKCKIDDVTKLLLLWSRVYARLGEALTELVYLGVGVIPQGYVHLDPHGRWLLSTEDIPVLKDDEAALDVFLGIVARRNATTHVY